MNYFKCLKENFSQWTLSCVNIYMPLEDKELNPGLNVGIYILICLWSGFALRRGKSSVEKTAQGALGFTAPESAFL